MLCIYTDTTIDLNRALDFGHAGAVEGAAPVAHGVLNNFGVGLKAFQAALGDRVQLCAYTVQARQGEVGGYHLALARFGSVIDSYFAAKSDSSRLRIHRAGCCAVRRPEGGLMLDEAEDRVAGVLPGSARAARLALLEAASPWESEEALLTPMVHLLSRVKAAREKGGSGRGTLFIYHSDGSQPLPYLLKRCVPDAANRTAAPSAEPSTDGAIRLFVKDKDGSQRDLAKSLESAYLDGETEPLAVAWREAGVTVASPPVMPTVRVQGYRLDFTRHQWSLEASRSDTSALLPVRVDGVDEPIAFFRACYLPLTTPDGKRRKGSSTITSDRRWLHGQGLDGAFLVMHGRKVINDSPSAMWDGSVFEDHTSSIKKFYRATIAGGVLQRGQYGSLAAYWDSEADAVDELPKELAYERFRDWSSHNKATNLWPRCGFGVLALIHLNPSFFQLDASKTRVQRRECALTAGLSAHKLVRALRLAIACWSVNNSPPEALSRRPPSDARRALADGNQGDSITARKRKRGKRLYDPNNPTGAPPGGWRGLDADGPYSILNRRIEVYWEQDKKWYPGTVVEYHAVSPAGAFADGAIHEHVHLVLFEDESEGYEALLDARWHFLDNDGMRVDKDFVPITGAGGRIGAAPAKFNFDDFEAPKKASRRSKGAKRDRSSVTAIVSVQAEEQSASLRESDREQLLAASQAAEVARQSGNQFDELAHLRHLHELVQGVLLA